MSNYMFILLSVATLLFVSCNQEPENSLYIYNWSEYMPEEVIHKFEEETGIDIKYSTYDSNEAMYTKVKLLKGEGYYDIAVPSTYFVDRMHKEDLLHKLDKSKLSNWKNIDSLFLNREHDPDNNYSVPYLWGTSGIAIDTEKVNKSDITSWQDLWDPKYKNKVLLLDDIRDTFSMALILLDHSINTRNEEHIKQAYEKLKELKPNVRIFNAESPKQPLVNKEVDLGMIYNGEAVMAIRENEKIEYVYPKEGAIMWADSLVILKGSKNVENAYKFIDFVLRPEISKIICESIGYSSPNKEGRKLLDEKTRNNVVIYPPEEIIKKASITIDIGDAINIYQKYWEKLKSEN